jgi:hypothetical protein
MGEWRYNSTYYNLGIIWRLVATHTPGCFAPGDSAPCTCMAEDQLNPVNQIPLNDL